MNITLNKIDSANATITIDVAKEDYANEVEKNIKNLRKNAIIPGFRKGMVPLSRIRQMYGKSAMFEEVDKLVSDKLSAYIREEKLNILGEPLPSADEQKPLDFNTQEDFSFTFDIGLAPHIDIKLSEDDKLPYYSVEVTDDMIDKEIENLRANHGNYGESETIKEDDMVKGVLTELDENGEPKVDGIHNENTAMLPHYMGNEEEKAKFIGAPVNTTVVFNPYNAYNGNTAELSSLLQIGKDEASSYTGDFSFEIKEITGLESAEINQELFDKVFEPGTVTTEEAFREKLKETVAQRAIPDSDYLFQIDARKYLEEKVGELIFPEAFLKRWMLASSTEKTPESVEKKLQGILENLKYYLIRERLIEDYNITASAVDTWETAKQTARAQFAQYGMNHISDQLLENYVQDMLKKEDSVRYLHDRTIDKKLLDLFKEKFTIDTKIVTKEEFQKLLEGEKQEN